MKVTIEVEYPETGLMKYSYEDKNWDNDIEAMFDIMFGLLRQMGFAEKSIQNYVCDRAEEYQDLQDTVEK